MIFHFCILNCQNTLLNDKRDIYIYIYIYIERFEYNICFDFDKNQNSNHRSKNYNGFIFSVHELIKNIIFHDLDSRIVRL